MSKAVAIMLREYRAAVHTKAFVVGLLLVPLVAVLTLVVQLLIARSTGEKTLHYAVIDRTGELADALDAAAARHNGDETHDPRTGARTGPAFALEHVPPSPSEPSATAAQRLALSERHRRGELDGFLEIGADVLLPTPAGPEIDDRRALRYQSDHDIERDFLRWASRTVSAEVAARRLERHGVPGALARELELPVPQKVRGSTRRDPATGAIEDGSEEHKLAVTMLPAALVVLMLMMVLLGALPAMQSVVEEKQQRIAEVLLGSVPPFTLMLGKLGGIVLVTLTISAAYLGGAAAVAARFGVVLPVPLVAWFVVFLVLATMIYGSLFTAIGAAANDLKETQSLQMPATMLLTMPMLLLGAVLREPNGQLATLGSFFPFSAPLLMTARLATEAGVPAWQPWVAALEVLALALACVWAGGRIFRIGLLAQGKTVRLRDLARWVARG